MPNLFKKSLPVQAKVRGYEIKRLPLAGYLEALEKIKEFPQGILEICFPGKNLTEILQSLKTLNEKTLAALVGNVFSVAPRYVIKIVAELIGQDEDRLLQDPNIGLDGIMELIQKFWEINGLENFTVAIRQIKQGMRQSKTTTGSKT